MKRYKKTAFNAKNYANPPILNGYKYVCGEWNDGFVIEKHSDRSQFVWVPVLSLASNGTLDGIHYLEKFGRRNYMGDEFSNNGYNEPLTGELHEQVESILKYGGFYITRYNISISPAGKPQSIKGVMPCVYINFDYAKKVASNIENNKTVKSHLIYGAEYDSVLEWFIETGAKTLDEISKDSTKWGNHWNTENSPQKVVETGSRKEWCANKICDFAGNVHEWTQEQKIENHRLYHIIRGGNYNFYGDKYPVAYRYHFPTFFYNDDIGFRSALCIK